MSTDSDLAELSSLRTALSELMGRVVTLADRYAESPDSVVAASLFEAERHLGAGRRALEQAVDTLGP